VCAKLKAMSKLVVFYLYYDAWIVGYLTTLYQLKRLLNVEYCERIVEAGGTLQRGGEEAVVACLKVFFLHSPVRTEEDYERQQSG
jgi:hypothetical protein